MDAPLLELLIDTVTIAPFASRSPDGEATYGSAVNYAALVEYNTEATRFARISDPQGKTIIEHGTVYLDGRPTIGLQDKITLPGAATPQILNVKSYSDLSGGYVTEVWV